MNQRILIWLLRSCCTTVHYASSSSSTWFIIKKNPIQKPFAESVATQFSIIVWDFSFLFRGFAHCVVLCRCRFFVRYNKKVNNMRTMSRRHHIGEL